MKCFSCCEERQGRAGERRRTASWPRCARGCVGTNLKVQEDGTACLLVCRVARTRGESERNRAGGSTQWCNAAIGQWATAQDGAAWRYFSTPRALLPHLFRLRTRCLSLSTPPLPHSSLVTSVAPLSLSIVPLSLPLTLSLSPCLSLTLFLGYCCIYSLPLLLSLVVSLSLPLSL